jgi:hypothetical protein
MVSFGKLRYSSMVLIMHYAAMSSVQNLTILYLKPVSINVLIATKHCKHPNISK